MLYLRGKGQVIDSETGLQLAKIDDPRLVKQMAKAGLLHIPVVPPLPRHEEPYVDLPLIRKGWYVGRGAW